MFQNLGALAKLEEIDKQFMCWFKDEFGHRFTRFLQEGNHNSFTNTAPLTSVPRPKRVVADLYLLV